MTFGVDALDWTNVSASLRKYSETFAAPPAVGVAWITETPDPAVEQVFTDLNTPVLPKFTYYDGETAAQVADYQVYLWEEAGVHSIVTTKETTDGESVIDITPLTLLYPALDDEGNQILTEDSTDASVEKDVNGEGIAAAYGNANYPEAQEAYNNEIEEVFNTRVDADTAWVPDHMLTVDGATTGDSYQEVDSIANADTTSWVRLRARNGLESIYFTIPTASMTEHSDYESFLETLPETFTFDDNTFFYPHGTVVELDTPATAAASTVESTSLNYVGLSSTYTSNLSDLNEAYDALAAGTLPDPCASKPNSTMNNTTGNCDCDAGYPEDADGNCVAPEEPPFWDGISVWVSDAWAGTIVWGPMKARTWIAIGTFAALGGFGWLLHIFRKNKPEPEPVEKKTLGNLMDEALGSGKEIED